MPLLQIAVKDRLSPSVSPNTSSSTSDRSSCSVDKKRLNEVRSKTKSSQKKKPNRAH